MAQLLQVLLKRTQFNGIELQRKRREQELRERGARLQRINHTLQQNALVGRVLIDQIEALLTLSHNIALRELSNHAQRRQRRPSIRERLLTWNVCLHERCEGREIAGARCFG